MSEKQGVLIKMWMVIKKVDWVIWGGDVEKIKKEKHKLKIGFGGSAEHWHLIGTALTPIELQNRRERLNGLLLLCS